MLTPLIEQIPKDMDEGEVRCLGGASVLTVAQEILQISDPQLRFDRRSVKSSTSCLLASLHLVKLSCSLILPLYSCSSSPLFARQICAAFGGRQS